RAGAGMTDPMEKFTADFAANREERRRKRASANSTTASAPVVSPLTFIKASDWDGQPVPERQWVGHNRVPAGKVTILNGDGAAGKTTITLQLAVATPCGTDWLGAVIDTPGPAMFFSTEEDRDEIHRRLDAIRAHFGLSWRDLDRLHIHAMPE